MKRVLVAFFLGLAWVGAAAAGDKVFVYHLNGPPDLLDPAKCNNLRCQRVMWPLYESLINLSPDSKTLAPGLATSWTVASDGLTYTFQLRRGVRFHDGAPFTASSAKLNFERNYLPGSPFYAANPPNVREKLLAGLIRDIRAHDEYTLEVSLRNPKVHLLFLVPMVSPDAMAKYGNKLGEHPVGTGPFKFVRATADEIRLAAWPDYWGGRPKLDQISFRIIPDSAKATREFMAGRIDFLPEVEPVYLERIGGNPTTKLVRVPSLSLFYLGFRVDRKPFHDVRVRQAFADAINVERAVLFTSRGMAVPAYGPIPPGADGYDPALKRSRYQPETAHRLLTELGLAGTLRTSLVLNEGWGFLAEVAQAIKSDLAKVGVSVDLVPTSNWKDLAVTVRNGTGDFFVFNWFSMFTDPEIFLAPLFESGSVDNLTRFSNGRLDGLLQEARRPIEATSRLDAYRQAQRIIVEEAPIVPLFHEVRVSAYSTRASGLELNVHSQPVDRFAYVDVRVE